MTKMMLGPGGIKLVLDTTQVFPDDPGAGTPAMVYINKGQDSATFWCAVDTGECDDVRLSDKQCKWLQAQYDDVINFLYTKETQHG